MKTINNTKEEFLFDNEYWQRHHEISKYDF